MEKGKSGFLLAVLVGVIVFVAGCGGGGGGEPAKKAQLGLVSIAKQMTSYGSPSLLVVIKNIGDITVWNVACSTNAVDSNNTILDTAKTFFADLGDIEPGQSAQDEGVFFSLNSHDDYASLSETKCSYLERK